MPATGPVHRLLRRFGTWSALPLGLRHRVLRRLADPDRIGPTPFACDFFGLTYEGDLSSYLDWCVFFHGCYEPAVLGFLAEWTRPDSVVLDVGANVGHHSLFLAPRAGTVHAFEPWPTARARLEKAIVRNRLTNLVVHPVGLSDRDEALPYYAPRDANTGTGTFVAGTNALDEPGDTLPLVAGDAYLARAGIDRVDLVKIDCEGMEPRVLAGLRDTLARHRPVVAFELSEATRAVDFAALFGPGWKLFLIGGKTRPRLAPFAAASGAMAAAIPAERL